jgi:hypothetical protein
MHSPWKDDLGTRPEEAMTPVAKTTRELLRSGIAGGMDATEVADQVASAIREGRFWILTHQELRKDPIARARLIARQENPAFGRPSAHPHLARVVRQARRLLPG